MRRFWRFLDFMGTGPTVSINSIQRHENIGFRRCPSVRTFRKFVFVFSLAVFLWVPQLLAEEEEGLAEEFAATSTLQQDELEEEFELLEDQDIVFSAAKHEQDISDAPCTVTVISRTQIENSPCLDIPCLLSQVPELDVRFVIPMYQSVGARALTSESSDKSLVLLDGRDMNYEELGQPLIGSLPVHVKDIERIEVIRGPASALYGANAHSMIISIFTRQAKKDGAEVFLGGGEHGAQMVSGRLGKIFGNFHLLLTGGRELQDHWRVKGLREKEVNRVNLDLRWDSGGNNTRLLLGFLNLQGALLSVFFPIRPLKLHQASLGLQHDRSWLRLGLWADIHKSEFSIDLPLVYRGIKLGAFPDRITATGITVDADAQVNGSPWEDNLLLGGINYRMLNVSMELNDPPQNFQHRLGFFVQDEQRLWDKILINGAVRFDYNNITPLSISPRVAISFKPVKGHTLWLSVGQAFRQPPFTASSIHLRGVKGTASFPELETFIHDNLGNSNVKNEKVTALEIGYRSQLLNKKLLVDTDIFYNVLDDDLNIRPLIATNSMGLPDLKRSTFSFSNDEKFDSVGGSIGMTCIPQEWLWFNLNYTYRHSRYRQKHLAGEELWWAKAANRVPWEPAHMLNAVGQLRLPGGFKLALAAHARSSMDFFIVADGGLMGESVWKHVPENLYLNALASWRWEQKEKALEIGVRFFNLFNRGFTDLFRAVRFDGQEMGGELVGRQAILFLEGTI